MCHTLTKSLLHLQLISSSQELCGVETIITHFTDEGISSERLRNLTSIAQLVVVRAEIRIQLCLTPKPAPCHLPAHLASAHVL